MSPALEAVIVHVTDVDVDFSPQLRPQRLPIALEDITEVIVLLPKLRDFGVDLSGELIPDRRGVAVGSDGSENCLPDVPLVPRAGMRPEGEFPVVHLLEGGTDLA